MDNISQTITINAKLKAVLFFIVSLIMSFGGLTSAFIVSSVREDWLKDFQLPLAFTISLVLIISSSITFILAKQSLKSGNRNATTIFLLIIWKRSLIT